MLTRECMPSVGRTSAPCIGQEIVQIIIIVSVRRRVAKHSVAGYAGAILKGGRCTIKGAASGRLEGRMGWRRRHCDVCLRW
jgi:hypothetical protein